MFSLTWAILRGKLEYRHNEGHSFCKMGRSQWRLWSNSQGKVTHSQSVEKKLIWFSEKRWKSPRSSLYSFSQEKMIYFYQTEESKANHSLAVSSLPPTPYQYITRFCPPNYSAQDSTSFNNIFHKGPNHIRQQWWVWFLVNVSSFGIIQIT